MPHPIPNQPDGTLKLDDIARAIRPDDQHYPRTRLIELENTHNRCDGSPLAPEFHRAVFELARSRGLQVHVDGARIFNAAVALGIDPREITQYADSVCFCLSKGLSAPVGSLLCGTKEFVAEARRKRKMVGGGMRQAGILAAAGIVALETMIARLAEDHANAKHFAEGLADLPGMVIDPARVRTNILFFDVDPDATQLSAPMLVEKLERDGVLLMARNDTQMRAVTHYGVERADIDAALGAFKRALRG
jgi:threonine aldolase